MPIESTVLIEGTVKVNQLFTETIEQKKWHDYVARSSTATSYHQFAWRTIIEASYGHQGVYLMAESGDKVVGVLPLIKMESRMFGKQLVSMPFVNYGGACTESGEVTSLLLAEAQRIAHEHNIETIELRHTASLRIFSPAPLPPCPPAPLPPCPPAPLPPCPPAPLPPCPPAPLTRPHLHTKEHKVTVILHLQGDAGSQWSSFKPKVRNQIRKAEKSGLKVRVGAMEDLDSFYTVFARNMRDLGSPTHSKVFFHHVLTELYPFANIFSVSLGQEVVAASLAIGFKDVLEVPWASSIRNYISLCPNNVLYWAMIKYAIENGYKRFDFGRSTPGDGTYNFKKQWGAEPEQLYWQYWYADDEFALDEYDHRLAEKGRKRKLGEKMWRKVPLPLATWLGPKIRKQISL